MGRLVLHWVCVFAPVALPLGGCQEVFHDEPITQIIDSTGDGDGNVLDSPLGIAVDDVGNVYVSGRASDNVFKIEPNGTTTQIIDETGDGAGNRLEASFNVAVDGSGNVYVAGAGSDNAFKVSLGL